MMTDGASLLAQRCAMKSDKADPDIDKMIVQPTGLILQIATVRVDPPMAPQGAAAHSTDAHSAGRLPLPVCCAVSCR
jgi:hypothetical protein